MLRDAKAVGFVLTTDAERARSFYEGTLGLEFVEDNGFATVFRAGPASGRGDADGDADQELSAERAHGVWLGGRGSGNGRAADGARAEWWRSGTATSSRMRTGFGRHREAGRRSCGSRTRTATCCRARSMRKREGRRFASLCGSGRRRGSGWWWWGV